MCDNSKFFSARPRSRTIRSFSQHELAELSIRDVPRDICDFLQAEGLCAYQNDFLWTTLPQQHDEILSEWGLKPKQCITFLRTALGGLCFLHKESVHQLDPLSAVVYKSDLTFCQFMNLFVPMNAFVESAYVDVYERGKPSVRLEHDEMLALVPALPLGGSLESSRLEVVKMREQMTFLAQLAGNKARKV
jgi:hypothetical protein